MDQLVNLVKREFSKHFTGEPLIVVSPGRINLLGEHTDYNGGHVMPAAIDLGIVIAISKNCNNHLNLRSIDYNDERYLSLENPKPLGDWSDYITGVFLEMKHKNKDLSGFDMVFTGNVPIGSGLSSSAALECAVALGLNKIFNVDLDKLQLSMISQSAENNFVGVQCGLMDQYASLFGKADSILCMDCKENTHRYLQIDLTGYELVLCNSGVNHALADSDYNVRRDECQRGLDYLKQQISGIDLLCDVHSEDLMKTSSNELDATVYRRCKYVVEENERVIQACDAIENNDINLLGKLMYRTHRGLSKEFEISCPELDYLVDITKDVEGIVGSRMMGGGFGGCTINLIRKDAHDFFNEGLKERYHRQFGKSLSYIYVNLSDGGRIMD